MKSIFILLSLFLIVFGTKAMDPHEVESSINQTDNEISMEHLNERVSYLNSTYKNLLNSFSEEKNNLKNNKNMLLMKRIDIQLKKISRKKEEVSPTFSTYQSDIATLIEETRKVEFLLLDFLE